VVAAEEVNFYAVSRNAAWHVASERGSGIDSLTRDAVSHGNEKGFEILDERGYQWWWQKK
jgi:hypothetical protein